MYNIQSFDDFVLEGLVLEAASSKDIQRIQDIVTKSNGDENKMLNLANTMCKLITDKNKALDRALAADQILGADHPVTKTFADRAAALGIDVTKSFASAKVLPGSQRPSSEQFKSTRNPGRYPSPILPCGKVNLQTGQNKYFSYKEDFQINSTLEVWEIGYKEWVIVSTSGSTPIYQIGTECNFQHDQTGRPMFKGSCKLVDYIEAAHCEALIPLYGKSLSCYVYK
jgi:hypothetical protein